MSDTPPGWHPDPSGRHQYRFWDGSGWTDQVADSGQQSTDAFQAAAPAESTRPADSADPGTPLASAPGAGQMGASASQGFEGQLTNPYAAPPPAKRSRLPLIIGIGVVAAIIVGVAVVALLGGDDKKSTGAGTFTLKLAAGKVASHDMNLKSGDALYIKTDAPKTVQGAFTADQSVVERLHDNEFLSDNYKKRAASLASDLFSDYSDYPVGDLSSDKPEVTAGSFTGVVIRPIAGQFYGSTTETVIPVKGRYSVVFISKKSATVKLTVKVKSNPAVKDDISSNDISDLDSDFYTEFYSSLSDESSLRARCPAPLKSAGAQHSSHVCARPAN